ncbi:MAG TPA: peptidylprolyl isomerase [Candidatus Kapabacteria bacterium]|nr:peptidylprolyl isomerase [Candidatus Kapabacteria bacterium]
MVKVFLNIAVVSILLIFGVFKMDAAEAKANDYRYEITVTQSGKELGKMVVELFPDVAPKHVANFDSLVSVKFYDGCAFHRVIPGFMIQGGDPNTKDKPKNTWGMGDPSQTRVPAEFNKTKHVRGILSAARSQDPNSASSQFFIMTSDAPHLDGQYSAYGKVVSGIEVADKIVNTPRDPRDCPLEKVEMKIRKIK